MSRKTSAVVELYHDPAVATPERPFMVGPAALALLMDAASVVITKPGGSTTAEIAYRGVPALFDASGSLLHWEEFTVNEFEKAKRGLRLTEADPGHLRDQMETLRNNFPSGPNPWKVDTRKKVWGAVKNLLATPCTRGVLYEGGC